MTGVKVRLDDSDANCVFVSQVPTHFQAVE